MGKDEKVVLLLLLLLLVDMEEEWLFCTLSILDMSDFTNQAHQRWSFRRPWFPSNHGSQEVFDDRPRILLVPSLASMFHERSAVVIQASPSSQSGANLVVPPKGRDEDRAQAAILTSKDVVVQGGDYERDSRAIDLLVVRRCTLESIRYPTPRA